MDNWVSEPWFSLGSQEQRLNPNWSNPFMPIRQEPHIRSRRGNVGHDHEVAPAPRPETPASAPSGPRSYPDPETPGACTLQPLTTLGSSSQGSRLAGTLAEAQERHRGRCEGLLDGWRLAAVPAPGGARKGRALACRCPPWPAPQMVFLIPTELLLSPVCPWRNYSLEGPLLPRLLWPPVAGLARVPPLLPSSPLLDASHLLGQESARGPGTCLT